MPRPYRSEQAANNFADRIGGSAYVYECEDCAVTVKNRHMRAWHVGIDTGAPWHQDRTSCDVTEEVEAARDQLRSSNYSGWSYEF